MSNTAYELFEFVLPPLSSINTLFSFGKYNGSVKLIKGWYNYYNFKKGYNDPSLSYEYETLLKLTGGDVTLDFTSEIYDKYYIIVESLDNYMYYDYTVNATIKQYYVSDLKKACSNREHYGNCIVNNKKKSKFCAIIEYDTPLNSSKTVSVDVYKTTKGRGKDDVIGEESSISSDEPEMMTSYDPTINYMNTKTSVDDDRKTFTIIAIVSGIAAVAVAGLFGLYLYFFIKRHKGKSDN